MENFTLIQKIAVWALPILFAITVHEVAHGWVANKLGDPTAKMSGRLTLNPIKHIDPLGTIAIPLILMWLGGFIFGWAKPVPVNWQNLKRPRRDIALVAIAGPGANLVMTFIWAGVLKLGLVLHPAGYNFAALLVYMGQAGVLINIVLMVLNLLPIPPLDGSRVLSSFVSPRAARVLAELEIYGFLILVLLLATGILGKIIGPPIFGLYRLIIQLVA